MSRRARDSNSDHLAQTCGISRAKTMISVDVSSGKRVTEINEKKRNRKERKKPYGARDSRRCDKMARLAREKRRRRIFAHSRAHISNVGLMRLRLPKRREKQFPPTILISKVMLIGSNKLNDTRILKTSLSKEHLEYWFKLLI